MNLREIVGKMTPGPFKLMVKDARLEVWGADGYPVAYCGQFQGDGSGFVALRNVANELLDVVDAAKGVRDCEPKLSQEMWNVLEDALARLDEVLE